MRRFLYILTVFFVFFGSVSSSSAYFEDFVNDGYSLDPHWTIYGNGGNITINTGELVLNTTDIARFPYLVLDLSDLLSTEQGYVKIGFRYSILNITQGAGIVFTDQVPSNDLDDSDSYKGIWLWPSPASNIYLASNLCGGESICSTEILELVQNIFPNFVHVLQVAKDGELYSINIDGREYLRTSSRDLRHLWIGNTGILPPSQIWPEIRIDYIESGQGVPDPIPTPTAFLTPTPTQTPIPTPIHTVYYQFASPWGDDIYDTANRWFSSDPSIARWGCALTSAAMVLEHHNFDVDPGSLNDWLKAQPDGYIRNGLVNWLAISRYTKINPNSDGESLEYQRIGFDTGVLDQVLSEHKLGILAVPGHFVVAKEKSGNTYLINDPAYVSRNDLNSYGNTFTSLGVYNPSHTDLSYLMLVVDADINLTLKDSYGNILLADTFIDDPIADDIDGSHVSGEQLKTLLFQQPSTGEYTLELNGTSSDYHLDGYFYDVNGVVDLIKKLGLVGNGMGDKYQLTIGEEPTVSQDTNIDKLIGDLNLAYSLKKIKNRAIYKSLLQQLVVAKRNNSVFNHMLGTIRWQISLFKGIYIEKNTAQVLIEEINLILGK